MTDLLWLIVALPLAGAVINLLFGRRIGDRISGWLAFGFVAVSWVIAVPATVALVTGSGQAETIYLFSWIPAIGADAAILWDPLSALMTMIVTGVGSLIHLYSIGYMVGDERYPRFFAFMNLFIASMMILVLAANYAVMFVGWELVGLSSYLLISFWFTKPSAAAAGKKAFIVNRIGDWGFLVALMIIFASFGTFDFETIFASAPAVITVGTATAITLLLFVGATGKSAQLPLHIWLPDAMEGPTPVSALIHAATMVTAGVFMIA
ncbi:MAG: proton-conducting transporter membrane subunit, partial [Acidimicrobiia bacterium]